MLILITWLRYCLSDFSIVKSLFSSCPYSLKGSHCVLSLCPTLKKWGVMIHPPGSKVYTEIIWTYAWDISFYFLSIFYVIIYIYPYGLMDIYFMLLVIIQSYSIYFPAQMFSALGFGSSVSALCHTLIIVGLCSRVYFVSLL